MPTTSGNPYRSHIDLIRLAVGVVDDRNGKACSFCQSFVRNLLLPILGPIDWIFILGERQQRPGKKAAHTLVFTMMSRSLAAGLGVAAVMALTATAAPAHLPQIRTQPFTSRRTRAAQ